MAKKNAINKKLNVATWQLFAIAVFQAVGPLIILPIMVTRIGLEAWGQVISAASFGAYASYMVTLNNETLLSREIIDNQGRERVQYIWARTMVQRLVLSAPIVGIGCAYLILNPVGPGWVITLAFAAPILKVILFGDYIHKGLGDYGVVLVCTILERIGGAAVCVLLVSSFDKVVIYQLYLVFVATVVYPLLVGYYYGLRPVRSFRKLSVTDIFQRTREALPLLLSKVFQLHVHAAKPILAMTSGPALVPVWDAAEKITNLLKLPFVVATKAGFSVEVKNPDFYGYISVAFGLAATVAYFLYLLVHDLWYELLLPSIDISAFTNITKNIPLTVVPLALMLPLGQIFLVKLGDRSSYGKANLASSVVGSMMAAAIIVSASYSLLPFWPLACELVMLSVVMSFWVKRES